MAPIKFGLFKARSRDQQEQPSTENLLQSSNSIDQAGSPDSPIPSTSKGLEEDLSPLDFAELNLNDDDMNYRHFQNPSLTSTATLNENHINDEPATHRDASTSYDAHSSQLDINSSQFDINSSQFDINSSQYDINYDASEFDASSIAPSEDLSVYCAMMKKPKKSRSKEQHLRDIGMWQATNIEVMQNLLNRRGTLDEQIKWEAIATARGLCTLTDNCTCADCSGAKYMSGISEDDGGMAAAPLLSALNMGCQIQ
ncbi:uncharacterized protein LOC125062227 isoform X2 [Pieris napi]|uniref:uncharacterized protein LOC125062227 isoform X2 n=1 Tax=Pieris napi TaxID=78633 RepID=UPI001FB8EDAB|nr:uncharacterized protein LOC125062227 isoform X2 [Pieris napi]